MLFDFLFFPLPFPLCLSNPLLFLLFPLSPFVVGSRDHNPIRGHSPLALSPFPLLRLKCQTNRMLNSSIASIPIIFLFLLYLHLPIYHRVEVLAAATDLASKTVYTAYCISDCSRVYIVLTTTAWCILFHSCTTSWTNNCIMIHLFYKRL